MAESMDCSNTNGEGTATGANMTTLDSFRSETESEKPEVSELHRHIVPKYAARWRDLGVQLKIPEHHLNTIAVNNTSHPSYCEQCCKAILQKWMEVTPNATWSMLQMAIDCLSDSSHNDGEKDAAVDVITLNYFRAENEKCKRPTFRDVYNYVVPKCAHKWRFLGALLHFDQAELDTIFSNFRNDSEECCRNLLSRWLEKYPNTTWNQLLSAIDDLSQPPLAEITYQGDNATTDTDAITLDSFKAESESNKRPTLHDVYKYVVPKCAHKWIFLGVLLHFDQEELDIIFSNFQNDSEECCRSLLSRWLEKNSVASWNQLLSAIDGLPEYPLPKTTSHGDDPLHCLHPSNFMADIKYYASQHHTGTRKWLFDEIEQWLSKTSSRNKQQVKMCLITGNPGMGKSVFASKFCTYASEKKILAACFFFQHHKARRNNPNVLVKTLAYQLCNNIPCYKEKVEGTFDEKSIMQMKAVELFTCLILEPLHELPVAQDHKIIVIDGLDECDFESQSELLKLIVREFVKLPEWFGVIITTRPDQKILRKLTKIKPVFHLDPEDSRNINDIRIYLTDILKAKMPPEQLDSGVQLMVKKSEGMFLYFHYAAEAILEKEVLMLKDLETLLPDGVDDYYEQNFRRLYRKLGKMKYQLLFQAITAARSDFPQELVSPLLKVEQSEALQIIDTVSVLLPMINGCLTIFHKSIKDWIIDEDLAEDLVINPTDGHCQVALLCYAEYKALKTNTITINDLIAKPIYKYAIENLVYHLSKSDGKPNDIITLCNTVTDLQYMYYRLYTSQVGAKDLLDDLTEAKQLVPVKTESYRKLQLFANFLHRCAHIVSTHPHLIFQCALNEPQSMQLGVKNYIDNPGIRFPGLHMYLELINRPQNFAPTLAEYHCTNDVVNFDRSLDGKIIVCSDANGRIYVWDKYTGELLSDLSKKERAFMCPISICNISPNGKEILVGDISEVMGTDGSIMPLFEDDDNDITACIFSPNEKYILGWSYFAESFFRLLARMEMDFPMQFCLQVWNRNANTSKLLERTSKREVRPLCACFSYDSNSILCGHRDGWIIIWETETGKPKAMLSTDGTVIKSCPFKRSKNVKDDPFYDIASSPNGHYIAACYSDGMLIWDAAALNLVQRIQPNAELLCEQTKISYTGCSFSGDSQHLAAGLSNGYLNTWIIQTTTVEPLSLQLSTNLCGSSDAAVNQCMFDNEKNLICSIGNIISVYDYQTLLRNPISKTVPYYADSCEFLSDGHLALTNGNSGICIWNVVQGALIAKTDISVAGRFIKLSHDKRVLLTYGSGCIVQVWDIDALNSICMLTSNEGRNTTAVELTDPEFTTTQDICSCAVSPNNLVAGGTGEGKIHIWHGKGFELVKVLKDHQYLITCLEFSPNSNCLVSADMEGYINMWLLFYDEQEELEVHKVNMQSHRESIEQVVFSPGQLQRIVSGGADHMLHLYDGVTGDLIKKMEGHKSGILKIAYSKCGRFLVSGDGKCQLILWDGITGQLLRYFNSLPGDDLLQLYFTGNDEYICTLDANQDQLTVYNITNGMPVSVLGFSSPISTLAASSLQDGITGYVICGMKDGSVKFLKLIKLQ